MKNLSVPAWLLVTLVWAFIVGMGIYWGEQAGRALKGKLDE